MLKRKIFKYAKADEINTTKMNFELKEYIIYIYDYLNNYNYKNLVIDSELFYDSKYIMNKIAEDKLDELYLGIVTVFAGMAEKFGDKITLEFADELAKHLKEDVNEFIVNNFIMSNNNYTNTGFTKTYFARHHQTVKVDELPDKLFTIETVDDYHVNILNNNIYSENIVLDSFIRSLSNVLTDKGLNHPIIHSAKINLNKKLISKLVESIDVLADTAHFAKNDTKNYPSKEHFIKTVAAYIYNGIKDNKFFKDLILDDLDIDIAFGLAWEI
ncbi:MAG: hypothetical protein SPF22_07540 [Candidatus Onthovivens sp.]|nr:hypothetical protein [Candidatus Onthovivens sp.]